MQLLVLGQVGVGGPEHILPAASTINIRLQPGREIALNKAMRVAIRQIWQVAATGS